MAWRSSGATNEELIDNLVENGLINNQDIENAFRRVDRKFFVPKVRKGFEMHFFFHFIFHIFALNAMLSLILDIFIIGFGKTCLF
mmetsp:Transcript_2421/g.2698  ORF Transcript_2421/g.2698 Transcript_2421/m.2698 type:complete len:85 (-) Transcript_2421:1535-1789(-)